MNIHTIIEIERKKRKQLHLIETYNEIKIGFYSIAQNIC